MLKPKNAEFARTSIVAAEHAVNHSFCVWSAEICCSPLKVHMGQIVHCLLAVCFLYISCTSVAALDVALSTV